jgi:uncharacterized protein (TIGR02145 family)
MKLLKVLKILCLSIIASSLYCCKTEEIILHGEINGIVTDTTTNQPLKAIPVKLNPINDTTSTGVDGKYKFISLIPNDYYVEVSKLPYATSLKKVTVTSAKTTETDFALRKIPYPLFSVKHLDFGFDSTSKSFTITNVVTKKLTYSLFPSQDWIIVSPGVGEATNETNTIKVTINRTGLSDKKHIEYIEVESRIGLDRLIDTVYVLVNGVMDKDFNYYNVITIGTQTWMQENLNVGKEISIKSAQTDNGITEKWCIDCKTYGGLYTWWEMMQYNPQDTIGPVEPHTQEICPDGWHVPTDDEWAVLQTFIGGAGRGGNLKETGTSHWQTPNDGATNETGLTALPGGNTDYLYGDQTNPANNDFYLVGKWALFWSAGYYSAWYLQFDSQNFLSTGGCGLCGKSIRCIKDSP